MNTLRKPVILAALMAVLATDLTHAQFQLRQRRTRKPQTDQTAEQQPSRGDRRGRLTRANPRLSGGKNVTCRSTILPSPASKELTTR